MVIHPESKGFMVVFPKLKSKVRVVGDSWYICSESRGLGLGMTSSQSCSSCSKATSKGFSQSSHGVVSRGVGITPICHCGDIAVMKVARTSRNAGRKFWGCRHYKGGISSGMSCNFFKWCSEDNADDKDGTIVRQSNRIFDLENNVKELQRRIKFLLGVVFAVIVLNIMTLWLCLA